MRLMRDLNEIMCAKMLKKYKILYGFKFSKDLNSLRIISLIIIAAIIIDELLCLASRFLPHV